MEPELGREPLTDYSQSSASIIPSKCVLETLTTPPDKLETYYLLRIACLFLLPNCRDEVCSKAAPYSVYCILVYS